LIFPAANDRRQAALFQLLGGPNEVPHVIGNIAARAMGERSRQRAKAERFPWRRRVDALAVAMFQEAIANRYGL
jgi:hypothetical protein